VTGVRVLLVVLLPVLLLAACSGGRDEVTAEPAAGTELAVEVVAEPGAEPRSWTLTCEPPGGDHPDPDAACAALTRSPDALAPLPADVVCTEVYGGPQTAVVRGTSQGREVALELSRTDGCRTDQWDRLGALLPAGPAR
jgi:hypothetical protein